MNTLLANTPLKQSAPPAFSTILLLATCTILFNIFDALYTAQVVNTMGATELNPLMAYLLQQGTEVFLLGKLTIIVTCIGITVRLRNEYLFNTIAGFHVLVGAFLLYASVMLYELLL